MMETTRRKVICWKDDTEFEVEVEEIQQAQVTVVLGTESKVQKKVGRKYIVKCPKCGAENEVRL